MTNNILTTSYQIGRYIQSFGSEGVCEDDGTQNKIKKPVGSFSNFAYGPNPDFDQTKHGLILEVDDEVSFTIHTPYGSWPVLDAGDSSWKELLGTIQNKLGLAPFNNTSSTKWKITSWQDKKFDEFGYRDLDQFINREKILKIWNDFAATNDHLKIKH